MSAEETAAETIKKLEFQLAAAEEMMEMQKKAAQKNTAKTMSGVQVLQNLVGSCMQKIKRQKCWWTDSQKN